MSNTNFYLIRPYPNGVNRIKEFKKQECVGIGWSDLGDVSGMTTKAALRAALGKYFPPSEQKKLRSTLGTFMIFCLELEEGDYILAPENKMGPIHIGQVDSGYYYDTGSVSLDFAHQRRVKWIGQTFSREAIAALNNKKLVGALKFPGTAADLCEYGTELSTLLGIKTEENMQAAAAAGAVQFMKASYPLRPNVSCDVSFPTDMTAAEAQRFATFISTLSFDIPAKNG